MFLILMTAEEPRAAFLEEHRAAFLEEHRADAADATTSMETMNSKMDATIMTNSLPI